MSVVVYATYVFVEVCGFISVVLCLFIAVVLRQGQFNSCIGKNTIT